MIAYAQTFGDVTRNITNALQLVMPILFLVATIIFLWGVILYITAGGEEDKIKKGRKYIIWGLIGLFVMVAVWGIVTLLCSAVFGYIGCRVQPPEIPGIPGGGGVRDVGSGVLDIVFPDNPDD